MQKLLTVVALAACLYLSACHQDALPPETAPAGGPEAISLFGDSLYADPPSEALLQQYAGHRDTYLADSASVDNLIWYGRFTAYKGNYREAIDIYSRGIERFPEDDRLYRHRGHRYITTRQLDKAVADLEQAALLIEGKENEMEPDGMPNAQNIPVSSRHGNIWYHLGLAYYLQGNLEKARTAFTRGLKSLNNDDNLVSVTHWLYMINRRMGDTLAAQQVLQPIEEELEVIENFGYHRATLFYKGLLSEDELMAEADGSPAGDAVQYALANWYLYNGDTLRAQQLLREILTSGGWASFGYLAAEADLAREFD